MPITVKASFFGPIKRPWPEQSRELEVPEGFVVSDLLARLGYEPEHMRRVAVVRGGKRIDLGTELADGDDIRFVLLAGGG